MWGCRAGLRGLVELAVQIGPFLLPAHDQKDLLTVCTQHQPELYFFNYYYFLNHMYRFIHGAKRQSFSSLLQKMEVKL